MAERFQVDLAACANPIKIKGTAEDTVIAIHAANGKNGGKSADQWRVSLRDYVLPIRGTKRVNAIATARTSCASCCRLVKRRDRARVRQRIGAVLKWAIAQGIRGRLPVRQRRTEPAAFGVRRSGLKPSAATRERIGSCAEDWLRATL